MKKHQNRHKARRQRRRAQGCVFLTVKQVRVMMQRRMMRHGRGPLMYVIDLPITPVTDIPVFRPAITGTFKLDEVSLAMLGGAGRG